MTVITEKQAGESRSTPSPCQPETDHHDATVRDFTGLVIAAGVVVLAATLFSWMLFSL